MVELKGDPSDQMAFQPVSFEVVDGCSCKRKIIIVRKIRPSEPNKHRCMHHNYYAEGRHTVVHHNYQYVRGRRHTVVSFSLFVCLSVSQSATKSVSHSVAHLSVSRQSASEPQSVSQSQSLSVAVQSVSQSVISQSSVLISQCSQQSSSQ